MRHEKQRFDQASAQIVLVSMGSVERTAEFKAKFDLPFAMLSDPRRELYGALNIGFMSLLSTFSPKMALRAASAVAGGHGIGVPYGDIRQLPAVFIIDSDGMIRHSHVGKDASDHPDPREILAVL